jgi:gluconate kinase
MKIFILFGLPGTGKTFVGKVFKKYFDFYFYDGDVDLTEEMKVAIDSQSPITDAMRDRFFWNLIENIEKLTKKHQKIVIAQTFIKEKYRKQLLEKVPQAEFIFIDTDTRLREKRLADRTYYPLEKAYARIMSRNFDVPEVVHRVIKNNVEGEEYIIEQLKLVIPAAPLRCS